MELAKIRNKARLEERETVIPELRADQPIAVEQAALTEVASEQTPLIKPVLFAASQLAADASAVVSSVVKSEPIRPFDPLAVILAGRENAETGWSVAESEDNRVETTETVNNFEEFLCFMLAGEEYGVNIMEIKEIIKPRELTEVPRTPQFVDGVLSLRGVIVPVIDMRNRLDMPAVGDQSQERIVIVRSGDSLTGLKVDRVTGVVRIADTARESTPGVLDGAARDFVSGIGRSDGRMIIILDVESIMGFSFGEGL